mmetsp:Transcript_51011/g.119296  ORF Transcript_51011/g.119296 Transcript_51011/m.119296 type:complete len:419 (+) Transcript_51011:53-1309(+)
MQRLGKGSDRWREDVDLTDGERPVVDLDLESSRLPARHRKREKSSGSRRRWSSSRWTCGLSPTKAVILVISGMALLCYQVWVVDRLLSIEQNLELMQKGKGRKDDEDEDDDQAEDDDEDENERQDRLKERKDSGGGKGQGVDLFKLEAEAYWSTKAHLLTAEERLRALRPMVWINTPFSSGDFLFTLLSHTGLCPAPATPGAVVLSSIKHIAHDGRLSSEDASRVQDFLRNCQGSFAPNFPSPPHHVGFGDAYLTFAGRGATLLRQPERRVLAQYLHEGLAAQGVSIGAYASQNAGCAVRMLTRSGKDVCGADSHLPTAREVDLATRWLKQGFAFVGIVEEWGLSVCLFHVMFGGQCSSTVSAVPEFSAANSSLMQQMAADQMDGALYDEGLSRFAFDKKQYAVSEQRCALICQPAAP